MPGSAQSISKRIIVAWIDVKSPHNCCLGAAETYTPLRSNTGQLPAEHVDHGLAEPCRGHEEGTFFAAGNDDTNVAGDVKGA